MPTQYFLCFAPVAAVNELESMPNQGYGTLRAADLRNLVTTKEFPWQDMNSLHLHPASQAGLTAGQVDLMHRFRERVQVGETYYWINRTNCPWGKLKDHDAEVVERGPLQQWVPRNERTQYTIAF